jgi:hypothetical protein
MPWHTLGQANQPSVVAQEQRKKQYTEEWRWAQLAIVNQETAIHTYSHIYHDLAVLARAARNDTSQYRTTHGHAATLPQFTSILIDRRSSPACQALLQLPPRHRQFAEVHTCMHAPNRQLCFVGNSEPTRSRF